MTTLAEAWETLSGPRVEDYWVELLADGRTLNLVSPEDASFEGGTTGTWSNNYLGAPTVSELSISETRYTHGSRSMQIDFPTAAATVGATVRVDTPKIGEPYSASINVIVQNGTPAVTFGDRFALTPLIDSTVTGVWETLTITWTATHHEVYLGVVSSDATTAGMFVSVDALVVVEGDEPRPSLLTEEIPMGRLDGVTSCRVEHNVNAVIRGGMSLSLRDLGQDIDWSHTRFRPWVRVNNLTWPLGVYLPASPSLSRDRFGSAWSVPCLDKTSVLDQDIVTSTFTAPAGRSVTGLVRSLIGSSGEAPSVVDSDEVVRSTQTWEPGTTRLRIVNDLLASINYFSLWADRQGRLRVEPYRRPQDRVLAATFAEGEAAIHSPQWAREQDIAGVPNRVLLMVEGDEENPGLLSVAQNNDPESPYSTASRGRVVSRVYENVEATDQATLDALAARYLADASTPSATLSVAHAAVPLDGNAVVRFADGPVDTLAVVEGWQCDLEPGALMTGSWREVLSA